MDGCASGQCPFVRAARRLGNLGRRALVWPARAAARRRFRQAEIRRLLVIDLGGLGNAILSLPLLGALRRGWPRATIHLLVAAAPVRDLLAPVGLAEVIDVVPVEPPDWLPREEQLAAVCWKEGYDLLVVGPVHGVGFFQGLAARLGVPFAAGEDTGGAGHGYTHPAPFRPELHEAERGLLVARALGLEANDSSCRLAVPEDERAKARERLAALGAAGEKGARLVALHPGGGEGGAPKRWPAENFAALVAGLRERGRGPFVILGGPEEKELAEKVRRGAGGPDVFNLAGETPIGETAALLAAASLVVANDTGLMHLAEAVGTPVVAIFGPTSVAKNRPRGPRDRVVELSAPCAPCYPRPAADCDRFCLDRLPVAEVLAACE